MARYYRSYLELMEHWDEVLPGRVLHLCYEDAVENGAVPQLRPRFRVVSSEFQSSSGNSSSA